MPSTNNSLSKFMWQINFSAFLYGSLLLLLLFRKKDDGGIIESASMPSFLAPLLSYSLHLAIIVLTTISFKNISFNKLKPPPFYILFYIFAIFFYNARVFDSNEASRSLVGIALPLLMTIAIANNTNRHIQSLICRKALTLCFGAFSAINGGLLMLGYGYQGFRFSGITFHPNQLGLVAGLSSVFFVTHIFNNLHFLKKIISICFLILSATLLIASGSRGALLATTIGVTFYLILERKILPLLITAAISTITILLLSTIAPENLAFIQSRMEDSGDNRSDVWLQMFSAFIESPFIGMGLDAAGSENSILKALAVGGIICGLPVALITAKIIKTSLLYFLDKNKATADSVYYCLLISIFTASLLDGYLFEKFGFTSTLLLLILSFIIKSQKHNKTSQKDFMSSRNTFRRQFLNLSKEIK